jgi:adenine-specific DNA-methyltransferase
VQIGDENVHLVRGVLDEVFGSENFVAQISFRVKSALATDFLGRQTDFLLWYARDREMCKWRRLYVRQRVDDQAEFSQVELPEGERLSVSAARKAGVDLSNARFFTAQNLASSGYTASCTFTYELDGSSYAPPGGHSWKTTLNGMNRLALAKRLVPLPGSLRYAYFFEDFPYQVITDVWMDTFAEQSKSYVVQTQPEVVQRCMLMTTDPGDLVLDPTCGSGTTAYVAEQWGRRWITVDTSRIALTLARERIMGSRFPYYLLADSVEGRAKEAELTGQPLASAETRGDIRRGFVYERVQHVTLKSIANNPDIVEEMGLDDIDAAIKRHADFEVLVDRPYEQANKVRVAGPLTIESLSPHRSIAFAGDPPVIETRAEHASSTETFETSILENLRRAGIQNGKRKERLEFGVVEPHAGQYIQAIGRRDEVDAGPLRIGIALGPQYGTVGPAFIKDAAREAIADGEFNLLCVLGFAFDPQAIGATTEYISGDEGFDVLGERSLGPIPVLLVRMNSDLLMGDELKKTGGGNLFTVFGEPDIEIANQGDETIVQLHGIDVYDPTTGEVRSGSTDQIALWMIDTDYNGESFFVRHCYFTGGRDPYKRLKRALRAEIDADAWASLYRTVSRPFSRPESGRIAVKVINDYGDEVVKVFDV